MRIKLINHLDPTGEFIEDVSIPVILKQGESTLLGEMLVDTGSNRTMVRADLFSEFDFNGEPAVVQVNSVQEDTTPASVTKLDFVHFGDVTRKDVEVLSVGFKMSKPFIGLFGMDLLQSGKSKKFKLVVDLTGSYLEVSKR